MKRFFHWDGSGLGRGTEKAEIALPDPSWVRYGQTLIVCGRPGIGKTRLADRLRHASDEKDYGTTTIDATDLVALLDYWSQDTDDLDPVLKFVLADLLVIDAWREPEVRLDRTGGLLRLLALRKGRSQILTTQLGLDYWVEERDRLKAESQPYAGFADAMYIIQVDDDSWQFPRIEEDIPF